jgi:ribonuclease Z
MLRVFPLSDKAVLSTSILVDWDGVKLLLDVGPGATTEIYNRKLGLSQIQLVLISHAHIDHFWDLVPLLWLRRMLGYKRKILVICPKHEYQLFEWCAKVSQAGDLADVIGIEPEQKLELVGLEIEAFQVEHAQDQLCLGYTISERTKRKLNTEKLVEKGVPIELWRNIAKGETINYDGQVLTPEDYSYEKRRKVVYSGDTRSCNRLTSAAKDATLLIVEATFLDESYQDLAHEYGHMIVKDAVKVGVDARVENILLTHRSLRHTSDEVLSEARKTLPNELSSPQLHVGTEAIVLS